MRLRIVLFIVLAATWVAVAVAVKQQPRDRYQATTHRPAASPSGKYLLVVVRGYDGNVDFASFQITTNEPTPRVLYCDNTHFRTYNTTHFLWAPDDKVWVYSGDIGTYYWTRIRDNQWRREVHYEGQLGAPTLLKKLEPDEF